MRQSSDKRIYHHCLNVICFLLLGVSLFGQNGEYPYYIGTPESEVITALSGTKFEVRYTEGGVKYYIDDGIERGISISQLLFIDKVDKTVFAFIQEFSPDEFGELALSVFLEGVMENSIEISQTEWRLYKYGKTVNISLVNDDGKRWSLIYQLAK